MNCIIPQERDRVQGSGLLEEVQWASDPSARWRFGPIHHEARAAGSADQPDSISHVGNIGSWRDVRTIEAPPAPRANRVRPAGKGGVDAFDFMGFELFGHMERNFSSLFSS